jgi:hypothetical protein
LIAPLVVPLVAPGLAPRLASAPVPTPATVIGTLVMAVIARGVPVCAPALSLHLAGGSQRREHQGHGCDLSFHGDS